MRLKVSAIVPKPKKSHHKELFHPFQYQTEPIAIFQPFCQNCRAIITSLFVPNSVPIFPASGRGTEKCLGVAGERHRHPVPARSEVRRRQDRRRAHACLLGAHRPQRDHVHAVHAPPAGECLDHHQKREVFLRLCIHTGSRACFIFNMKK